MFPIDDSLRRPGATLTRAFSGSLGRLVYWAVVVCALILFVRGALDHAANVNDNPRDKDQGAYLELATRIAESGRIEIDGARPPLYPALLALGFDSGLTKDEFFERCKLVNIALTTVAACALLFLFSRYLSSLAALTAWLAVTFTVLLFYAPYVKAEGPFFVLATASFVGLLALLWRPSWHRAAVVGVVIGVAELFKEFTTPMIALFVVVQSALVVVRLVRTSRCAKPERRYRAHLLRAVTIPVVLASSLLVRAPHLAENARVFGQPFYNVNTRFYLWYDSWGQVERGTKRSGDRWGFPEMSPEELPSAEKYFRTHSSAQVRGRVEKGLRELYKKSVSSHGFYRYVVIALFAAAVAATNQKLRRWLFRNSHMVWFTLLYVCGYVLACAWFYSINGGVRFVVSLVGPLVFVGAWLSDRAPRWFHCLSVWTVACAAALAADIPAALQVWVQTMKSAGW